jgi:uncharacterized protein (TIGR02118 family)
MYKFISLYRKPDDPAAFDAHYAEVHTPLVMKTPGLIRCDVTKITGSPMGGEPAYYQISEMFFENRDAFKSAARSPEWAAAGKDLMGFAGSIVTLLVGEGA